MAVAMVFVPDSPVFLVHKGKMDAARKSIKWLRGSQYDGVEDEMECEDGMGLGGRPEVFSALLLLAGYDGDSCFEKS